MHISQELAAALILLLGKALSFLAAALAAITFYLRRRKRLMKEDHKFISEKVKDLLVAKERHEDVLHRHTDFLIGIERKLEAIVVDLETTKRMSALLDRTNQSLHNVLSYIQDREEERMQGLISARPHDAKKAKKNQ